MKNKFDKNLATKTYLSYFNKHCLSLSEDQLYGIVNKQNLGLILSESYLDVTKYNKIVFVVNFVKDALEDMIDYINQKKYSHELPKDGILNNFKPYAGWESFQRKYNNHVESMIRMIAKDFKNSQDDIQTFEEFQNFLIKYLSYSKNTIITQESYLRSNFVNHRITGLSIQISKNTNLAKWYNDPVFQTYLKILKSFNFYCFKEEPWNIIFDIKKTNLYMGIRGFSDYSQTCYYTYESEIQNLQKQLFILWNTLSNVNKKIPYVNQKYRTDLHSVLLNKVSFNRFKQNLSEWGWKNLYFTIRLVEKGFDPQTTITKREISIANTLNQKIDMANAVGYINKIRKSSETPL